MRAGVPTTGLRRLLEIMNYLVNYHLNQFHLRQSSKPIHLLFLSILTAETNSISQLVNTYMLDKLPTPSFLTKAKDKQTTTTTTKT